eukprot:6470814-Amphidinium_carterae.2
MASDTDFPPVNANFSEQTSTRTSSTTCYPLSVIKGSSPEVRRSLQHGLQIASRRCGRSTIRVNAARHGLAAQLDGPTFTLASHCTFFRQKCCNPIRSQQGAVGKQSLESTARGRQ